LRDMLTDVVQSKRQFAYQTTMAALRIFPPDQHECLVRAAWCGDTGIFSFTDEGKLLWSNLGITSGWNTQASTTHALPDDLERVDSRQFVIGDTLGGEGEPAPRLPSTCQFLLATDGFYTAFSGFEEMSEWLQSRGHRLRDEGDSAILLRDLHTTRAKRASDDDISLLWVTPTPPPSP
jgi:hypothetical protein